MAPKLFNFTSLADFDDGRIREAVDLELNRARLDCEDRPGLKQARKVTLTVILEPESDERGKIADVQVSFDIQARFPKRASRPYTMAAKRGHLVFNDLSPDDPNQMTLDQVGSVKGVVGAR